MNVLPYFTILLALGYHTTSAAVPSAAYNNQQEEIMRHTAQVQSIGIESDNSTATVKFATVTAYTAQETCHNGCIMASGKKAYVGAVACPRALPFGTTVEIDGIGKLTCEDRTALKYDGRFDVFFGYSVSDYQRAKQFGRQKINVIIN